MKLGGKIALITGCSPNINGGIAYGLADEGATVVCVDINPAYAEGCATGIRERGGEALAVVADVTDEAQVQAAVTRARDTYGGVDILLNGAVIQIRKGLLDMPLVEWRRQLDVSLTGAFLFSKHVAALMIAQQRRGCLINVISTEGHQGNPGNIGYGTAKSGLLNFTRAVAMELAPHGIRVNSLTPTATDPAEGLERVAAWGVTWDQPLLARQPDVTWGDQGVPLGHRPSPRHYARAAVFLATDDAEMITGFDLRVDGGTIGRYWRWNPGATIQ
jgi:NAD(P)-dependent dehydrogenase (short-subunit alcohol dehydrogenase family)